MTERIHTLVINSLVAEGQLTVRFHYNRHAYGERTTAHLAERYLQQIGRLLHHCMKKICDGGVEGKGE